MAHEKDELISQLSRARAGISDNVAGLRHDLDFSTKLRRSFADHKTFWLTGAAIGGLLLAKFPSRRKKIYVKTGGDKKIREAAGAGLAAIALKFALSALRPAATSFAMKKAAEWMDNRRR